MTHGWWVIVTHDLSDIQAAALNMLFTIHRRMMSRLVHCSGMRLIKKYLLHSLTDQYLLSVILGLLCHFTFQNQSENVHFTERIHSSIQPPSKPISITTVVVELTTHNNRPTNNWLYFSLVVSKFCLLSFATPTMTERWWPAAGVFSLHNISTVCDRIAMFMTRAPLVVVNNNLFN